MKVIINRFITVLALVALSSLMLTRCFKNDGNNPEVKADNIFYQKINDTLVGIMKDTLDIFSNSAHSIFEIYRASKSVQSTFAVQIYNKPTGVLCNCGHDFLCRSAKGFLYPVNYGDFITGNGLWGSSDSTYRLNDFTGKGEKYMGLQQISFPFGFTDYCYGWVKLYCSSRNDTLIIIDYAINRTKNNGIKAGQMN